MEEKPTIGVRPNSVWLIERAESLAEAINKRVFSANFKDPDNSIIRWCEELQEITRVIQAGGLTSRALDEVHAERTISMSCPSCHRLIEVVLLASLRQ